MNVPDQTTRASVAIRDQARQLGFELVGIAPAGRPESLDHFLEWLEQDYDGRMDYLDRRREAYAHTDGVLPQAASLIMLGMIYRSVSEPAMGPLPTRQPPDPDGPIPALVARYATGSRDYHDVLRERLSQLADFVHEQLPGCRTRGIVDTAPLLERDFARQAGLGWFGKNTMLLDRQMGSWFFLAALLVDRPLESDTPHTTDHCGTCTACLDACPTDAFPAPWVLDARRCISYLTIELRGDPIPGELREGLGSWLFGCDVCQDVCPWNRDTPATGSAEFEPREDLLPADVVPLLQLDEESYNQRFAGTPLDRPGRDGLVQNAAIVAGNSRQPAAVPSLVRLLEDDNPILRSSAAWALGRIAGKDGLVALRDRRAVEDNPSVQEEIDAALLVSPERSERE